MVIGFYTFIQNLPKRYIEVFYCLSFFVSIETIRLSLQVNATGILKKLAIWVI